jgi:hypothetical protein
MAKIIACSLIIKDDFNNVLILNNKVKRGEIETWSILNKKIKGKESHDKCITRGAKDAIKSLVFDAEPFKEYIVDKDSDESIMVYTGRIEDRVTLDLKKYIGNRWIGLRSIENFNLSQLEKEILNDFFKS